MFLTNFSPQQQKRLSTQNESDIIISLNAVKNKGERVGIRGKLHVQDYLDYFQIPPDRYVKPMEAEE